MGVTLHAVSRYQERVRPDMEFNEARAELIRLTRDAPAVEPPVGVGKPHLCLMIAPGVFVPCERDGPRFTAKTVLRV